MNKEFRLRREAKDQGDGEREPEMVPRRGVSNSERARQAAKARAARVRGRSSGERDNTQSKTQSESEIVVRSVELIVLSRDYSQVFSPSAVAAVATLLLAGKSREEVENLVAAAIKARMESLGADEVASPTVDAAKLDELYERADLVANQARPKSKRVARRAAKPTPRKVEREGKATEVDAVRTEATATSGKEISEQPKKLPGVIFALSASELGGVSDERLGREVVKQVLIRFKFKAGVIDRFLDTHPNYTYRRQLGNGEPIPGSEIREELDSDGSVKVTLFISVLEDLKAQVETSRRGNNSVGPTTSDSNEQEVRTWTDWIDWLTGTGGATSGDWPSLNALLVGLIRASGSVDQIHAGATRILGNVTETIGLDTVTQTLRQIERQQRSMGKAKAGADSQVTINAKETWRRREGAGIKTSLLERLPLLIGENPQMAAALLGPKAQVAVAAATPPLAFLRSYGSGKSATDSLKDAGWAGVQAAIAATVGRFGLAAETTADLAATYAILSYQGASDWEIEEQLILSLIQTGVGKARSSGRSSSTDIPTVAREISAAAKGTVVVREAPKSENKVESRSDTKVESPKTGEAKRDVGTTERDALLVGSEVLRRTTNPSKPKTDVGSDTPIPKPLTPLPTGKTDGASIDKPLVDPKAEGSNVRVAASPKPVSEATLALRSKFREKYPEGYATAWRGIRLPPDATFKGTQGGEGTMVILEGGSNAALHYALHPTKNKFTPSDADKIVLIEMKINADDVIAYPQMEMLEHVMLRPDVDLTTLKDATIKELTVAEARKLYGR